jgi:hypothetical protein
MSGRPERRRKRPWSEGQPSDLARRRIGRTRYDNGFQAFDLALDFIRSLREPLARIATRDADLEKQLRRRRRRSH